MIYTIPALSELMFEEIKGDFSSLWATNRLGDTLEIVTPYTDLYGDSIVVYLTVRNGNYIVSDGARIESVAIDQENINFSSRRTVHYYDMVNLFKVLETRNSDYGKTFCYKKTDRSELLSSIIYDMAHFQMAVLNAIYTQTLFSDDSPADIQFRYRVANMLKDKVNTQRNQSKKLRFYTNKYLRELSFLGGLTMEGSNEIWIGMSIYSRDANNLRESVRRAEFGFNHINETSWGLLVPVLRIGAIIDEIPQDLRTTGRAHMALTAMEKWQERFNVQTYAYEQLARKKDISFLVSGEDAA